MQTTSHIHITFCYYHKSKRNRRKGKRKEKAVGEVRENMKLLEIGLENSLEMKTSDFWMLLKAGWMLGSVLDLTVFLRFPLQKMHAISGQIAQAQ